MNKNEALEEFTAKFRQFNEAYNTYSGSEYFMLGDKEFTVNDENGDKCNLTVLDFWRYAYSCLTDIESIMAEFLVANALGIKKAQNVRFWTPYEMCYRGKRIEVKTTQYVQAWSEKISESRSFGISPATEQQWLEVLNLLHCSEEEKEKFIFDDFAENEKGKSRARQNDIYVFCLNKDRNISEHNPLDISNFEFFVTPTFVINDYCLSKKNRFKGTISLKEVEKFVEAGKSIKVSDYYKLKEAVDVLIDKVTEIYDS